MLAALQPDIVVESSPVRWHAYWLTNDYPLNEFRRRQQQIAAKFDGDPAVVDLPRVMRLPGFFHQKEEPFMTRVNFPEQIMEANTTIPSDSPKRAEPRPYLTVVAGLRLDSVPVAKTGKKQTRAKSALAGAATELISTW